MRTRPAALFVFLGLALAGFPVLPATAQSAQLYQVTDWRSEELTWRNDGGLPVNSEFSAPIAVQYNWAYGATALGLTTHHVGSADYYAVLALYTKRTLDAQDVLGPFSSPPQYSSGRYSLAVSTPDRLVYVWLTAPGADPRRVLLANDAVPGAPIACLAQPPDPPSAQWAKWRITRAYAYSDIGTQLEQLLLDGTGKLLDAAPGINLPGALNAVALAPVSAGWPQVMFAAYDPRADSGGSTAGVYLAAQAPRGWAIARLTDAASHGAVFPASLAGGQGTAIVVSDMSSAGAFLQQIQLADPTGGGLSQLGPYDYFIQAFSQRRYNLFESVLSALPLLALTDGAGIWLAWQSQSPGRAPGLPGYTYAQLYAGSVVEENQPAFPILTVAGTAHWNTGHPELYWVQQGSPDNGTGQLFRLAYEPNTK
jgi:hypothetical protein